MMTRRTRLKSEVGQHSGQTIQPERCHVYNVTYFPDQENFFIDLQRTHKISVYRSQKLTLLFRQLVDREISIRHQG